VGLLPFANAPGSSGGSGTVTSVSVATANGFSGTVANATTTPAITIIAGAIVPTTVNSITLSGSSTPTLAVTGTSSISGANTGDQTITLTGGVTGSGTGSFAATVVTNANLTGPITSSGNATSIANSIALPASPTTTTQSPADNSTKIATTAYVDNAVLGQNFKEAVKYASTAALPTVVYSSGAGTLTGFAVGAISLDGSSPVVADRVLIKNQVSTFQNGLYTVTATGSGIAVFVLTRTSDANTSGEFKTGDSVFVTAGSTLSSTTWAYTGIDSPNFTSDAITYAQVAGQGSFSGGNGITITGTSIAIDTSITVDKTTVQTLTNKTLTSPTLTTPTIGVASATSLATSAASPLLLTNGKLVTIALTSQTVNPTTLTIPDFASVNDTFAFVTLAQTFVNKTLTSPTLTTPTLGVASATTINKVTITAPATGSTLTIADGKTLTVSNSLTLAGTDGNTMTFPSGSDTVVTLGATQTLTSKTLTSPVINQFGTASGLGAAWVSWTPSYTNITVGNGTVVAKYIQLGKTTIAHFQLTAGTTSSWTASGTHLTLPATANSRYGNANSFNTVGTVMFNHVGGAIYTGPASITASTSDIFIYFFSATASQITGSTPIGFSSTDVLSIDFTYEAA